MAVIIGGSLILLYNMRWVDPAITIGIALYILYLAFTEIGGPIRTLMLGSPPDIDNETVVQAMRGVDGVADVHHVHLWQMQEHEAALDCHVVLTADGWGQIEKIKAAIKDRLKDDFSIGHSSLEFEHEDRAHENADLYGHGIPAGGVVEVDGVDGDVLNPFRAGVLRAVELRLVVQVVLGHADRRPGVRRNHVHQEPATVVGP